MVDVTIVYYSYEKKGVIKPQKSLVVIPGFSAFIL